MTLELVALVTDGMFRLAFVYPMARLRKRRIDTYVGALLKVMTSMTLARLDGPGQRKLDNCPVSDLYLKVITLPQE